MADEMSGFPDEPTFSLAAQASLELTQQRLFAAQNLLVKREDEIARLAARVREFENALNWSTSCTSCAALLDSGYRETCRREVAEELLAKIRATVLEGGQDAGSVRRAVVVLVRDLPEAAACDGEGTEGEGRRDALSAGTEPLDPCTRCNGSGSEPDTDPDEAAGLVLVAREDVKWALASISCYMPLGMVDEEQHAVLARLRDAAGGRTDAAVGDADHAGSPGEHGAAEGAQHCPRCSGQAPNVCTCLYRCAFVDCAGRNTPVLAEGEF